MVVWSPLKFNCGRETANRFAIAPLTTDSSHEDGTAAEDELEFVRRRAANGFGLTISSAAYVAEDGRAFYIDPLQRLSMQGSEFEIG